MSVIDDAFEWDDAKAATNHLKHGVTFETARGAFQDPSALDWADNRRDYDEERFILLGLCPTRLLYVAYTMRGRRIRIISARGATSAERRLYGDDNG